ncbi:tetraacyldisaccharide 4'-kinase [Bacteroidia bacterium]|nr:tetraacyldisaccharide 4'-kinase [Bacteroidia bacterium]
MVLSVRHILYNLKILRVHTFDFPVIGVGNLAVGGTGKTPHTLLIADILQKNNISFAVLLRGYKRKSKGFLYVENSSTAAQVGDEALLIKRRMPQAIVAVCTNRAAGIARVKREHPTIQAALLDDAFQHRKVNAGLAVLLTPYRRLMTQDALLPIGRLRDLPWRRHHADIVVATQCPNGLQPIDFKVLKKNLKLLPYQQQFCSTYQYLPPVQLTTGNEVVLGKDTQVVALAGIAHPQAFYGYLQRTCTVQRTLTFADHQHFGKLACAKIRHILQKYPQAQLVTTEKDAMRLLHCKLEPEYIQRIVYQPIGIKFLKEESSIFTQNILHYVKTNKGISLFC